MRANHSRYDRKRDGVQERCVESGIVFFPFHALRMEHVDGTERTPVRLPRVV